MPSDEQMRHEIKKVYPDSWNWANKVDAMPAHQVAAVYQRLLNVKKLKKR